MKSINGPSKVVTAATSVPSSWTQAAVLGTWLGQKLPKTTKPQQGQQLQAPRGKKLPSLYSTTGGGNGTAETPPRSGLPRVSPPPRRTLEAELLPVRAVARAAQPGAGQLLVDGLQDPHVHRLAVIQATWRRGFPAVTPGTPPLSPPGGTGATQSGRGNEIPQQGAAEGNKEHPCCAHPAAGENGGIKNSPGGAETQSCALCECQGGK